MAGQAGYVYTLSVSTTEDGTYNELPSMSASFNRTADVLDSTDTTNAGYHQRLLGLLDAACNGEVNWAAADTALTAVETAFTGRSELWVKILPNNVAGAGHKFPVVVESYNIDVSVTDLVKVSVSFQGTGAVIADDA